MYCTLRINSNSVSTLPTGLLKPKAKPLIRYVDTASQEQRITRERIQGKMRVLPSDPPWRYMWQVSTDGHVKSDELLDHLNWILSLLLPSQCLSKLKEPEYAHWLSVFWMGNGTGGGPLINWQCAQILAQHQMDLGIAFYLDENA